MNTMTYTHYQFYSFHFILPDDLKINGRLPHFLASTPRKTKEYKSILISKESWCEGEEIKSIYAAQYSQEVECGCARMKRKGMYTNGNLSGFEFVCDFFETATMKGGYVWTVFFELPDDIMLLIKARGFGKFDDDDAYWTPVVDSIYCDESFSLERCELLFAK